MLELIRQQSGSARVFTPIELFPEPLQTIFRTSLARSEANLAHPYDGISSDGTIRPGLFPIATTGMSLVPVVNAAQAFLTSLAPDQRSRATFAVESDEWHNMHVCFFRHGVCLEDLGDHQRHAALALVNSTLSTTGFQGARKVMQLNEHVAELTGRSEEFGEWYYYLSIFGEPSETEPWGWQLDGHHLIINCFVLGVQLVLTPFFSGS